MGTLLENIVLVEATRLLFDETEGGPVEFVNSFAMPPLAEWRRHPATSYFNDERIAACINSHEAEHSTDYAGLLRACCERDPFLGPNGALLVGVLATRLGKRLRYWLNDMGESPHYPGAVEQLRGFGPLLARLVPDGQEPLAVSVCNLPYDASLANLRDALDVWREAGNPVARIGFLDPDRYRVSGRSPAETSSVDHRRWLRIVEEGVSGLALSVHFTGHRNYPTLRTELESMRRDAESQGFQASLTARHGYYTTTISIHDPGGPTSARWRLDALRTQISAAWELWCRMTGGGLAALRIVL
jgi:hypothetical protein